MFPHDKSKYLDLLNGALNKPTMIPDIKIYYI
jgi:hypothetical protein